MTAPPPEPDGPGMSDRWRAWRAGTDLDEYDSRWTQLAASGEAIHGEAELIERFIGATDAGLVVDAGCGMGRVAIELDRRGYRVLAIDNDDQMLARGRAKDSAVAWLVADLATVGLPSPADTIALAGNVLIFCEPGSEPTIVANLAANLAPGGTLVAGHSLPDGARSVAAYDQWAAAAGLEPVHRFADWDGNPYGAGGDGAYAVFVDRRPV